LCGLVTLGFHFHLRLLVFGREAKPPALPAVSPSSPEIPHAKQFLSQTSVGRPPAHSKDSNSATNFIYDKSNDSEIKVMQR